ncbi:MAG: C4-dicarboxylate-specific signal transduction histidine kinase [bacterium]|jgi:C4-dicarboxylate-specific signal transduction histidine kinase
MLIELPDTSRTAVSLYLKRVATVACEKYSAYTTAVSQLRHQVEHVNTVVQAQQHFARHGGLVAEITVPDLLEHTLLLVASRLQAISVTKTAVPNVTLAADRHKTMLVLLNLINNAADALQGHLSPAIDIDLHADGGDLVIRVADNGSGISPANLERIFHHGFTTKPAGHGFGLHSSALAARELGGQLEVSSPGVGQGATFTFILPLAPLPVRAVKQQSSTLDM